MPRGVGLEWASEDSFLAGLSDCTGRGSSIERGDWNDTDGVCEIGETARIAAVSFSARAFLRSSRVGVVSFGRVASWVMADVALGALTSRGAARWGSARARTGGATAGAGITDATGSGIIGTAVGATVRARVTGVMVIGIAETGVTGGGPGGTGEKTTEDMTGVAVPEELDLPVAIRDSVRAEPA